MNDDDEKIECWKCKRDLTIDPHYLEHGGCPHCMVFQY